MIRGWCASTCWSDVNRGRRHCGPPPPRAACERLVEVGQPDPVADQLVEEQLTREVVLHQRCDVAAQVGRAEVAAPAPSAR